MVDQTNLQKYRDEGYLIVRSVFGSRELLELRSAVDAIELKAQTFSEDCFVGATYYALLRDCNPFAANVASASPIAGKLRRVSYPYDQHREIERLRRHPNLLQSVSAILGPDVVQIVNQVNFSPPGIGGGGWGWHQDYRFRKQGISDMLNNFVQCVLAIDPCNEFTGGLRVVPRSHELGSLTLDKDNESAHQFFDVTKAITPDLAPGDALLFNPYLIHGSGPNKSNHNRRVFINGYANAIKSQNGQLVLSGGVPVPHPTGIMEYEGNVELLPKASKY